jgi:mono/diheme cytochrome c family protein
LIDIVRVFRGSLVTLAIAAMPPLSLVQAQNSTFHNAPASARELKNPYEGQQPPNARALFHLRCARCHGENGEGSGNIPPLKVERIKAVTPGEIFWFITRGDVPNGMPSWATLPRQQRWQIVSYVQALGQPQSTKGGTQKVESRVSQKKNAPPPMPPYTDFRYEKPGQIRKIRLKDLPAPFATGHPELAKSLP